jgi:hypothetical protein
MTGGASPTPDPVGELSLSLPSVDESDPLGYTLAVDDALWEVSERLISRKHPSVTNLINLRKGLVALTKFIRQVMYPRKADAELNKLKETFGSDGISLLDMLDRTLSFLSNYIETLEELGPTGTVTVDSPADLGVSVDVKGEKRDPFIQEFNQLQRKFQETVKPLRT